MEKEFSSNERKICNCKNIPSIVHELSQSLVVIHSYAKGCGERLKKDNFDKEQLINHLETVNKHVQIISEKIQNLL